MLRALFIFAASLILAVHAKLVNYDFTVTRGILTTDGQRKLSWLVNGQSPGPLVEATIGDQIKVAVKNKGNESITIHWHGVEQLGTPGQDGVPGITQYPIKPGHSFTYKFSVTQTGSFWYHSHSHHQLSDGLRGPVFFKPSARTASSIRSLKIPDLQKALAAELKPFQLAAYENTHHTQEYIGQQWTKTNIEQLCVDDILINGKGQVICPNIAEIQPFAAPPIGNLTARGCANPANPLINGFGGDASAADPDIWFNCKATKAPLEVFYVSASDKYAVFNVINMGSLWELKVSIDSHSMWVFTADGAYVQPNKANIVAVPVGERYQILVPLDQTPDDYTIRVAANVLPQLISGYAVLSYKKRSGQPVLSPPTFINYAGIATNDGVLFDPLLLHPYPALQPPQGKADVTLRLRLTRGTATSWKLNGVSLTPPPDSFEPLLFNPAGVANLDPASYRFIKNGSLVDAIFEIVVEGGLPGAHPPHPMHRHNSKSFFLGAGTGEFPAADVWEAWEKKTPGLNLVDPPLRDSFNTLPTLEGSSWAVIRWRSHNPMPTLIHCHLDFHATSGMQFLSLEGLETLGANPDCKKY